MWIARDRNNNLVLHQTKPTRDLGYWVSNTDCMVFSTRSLTCSHTSEMYNLYKDLKWEDEPIEVDLIETFKLQSLRAVK